MRLGWEQCLSRLARALDGYTSGPEEAAGDAWRYAHAGQPQTAEYFEGIGAARSPSIRRTRRAS
jgi:hypothetical protein